MKEIGSRTSKLSQDSQYAIDKVVRERLKEGSFGYDNSQLLQLESQLRKDPKGKEENINQLLLEKLETPQARSQKMSYDDWLRHKAAEDRLKKQLMIPIYEYEWEQELLERQDKEMKKSESTKRVTEWFKKKQTELAHSHKAKRKEKMSRIRVKQQQRREAEIVYKQWLKQSLHKMRVDQKQQKQSKKLEERKNREIEAEEMRKKQEAEVKFHEWAITHKNLPKKKKKEAPKRKYKPIKRAYGLAYSLNKKKQPNLKLSFEDMSESDSESHVIQETSMEQSEDDEVVQPRASVPATGEYKIKGNKMFEDDLSCIQPNQQFPSIPPQDDNEDSEYSDDSEVSIDSNRSY